MGQSMRSGLERIATSVQLIRTEQTVGQQLFRGITKQGRSRLRRKCLIRVQQNPGHIIITARCPARAAQTLAEEPSGGLPTHGRAGSGDILAIMTGMEDSQELLTGTGKEVVTERIGEVGMRLGVARMTAFP